MTKRPGVTFDSCIPGKHKTMRKPDFPEIEFTLYEWFTKMTRFL